MKLDPVEIRDFSEGVYRRSAIDTILIPKNSVQHSINVNYDTIIGSAVVRPGTTLLGATVAANKTPLGLTEFTVAGGATNLAISVFSGAANASVYYYNTLWNTSGLTTLNNTAKCRFAQLANRLFIANGADAMKSSADGNTWNTTNCITTDTVLPSLLFKTRGRLLASGDGTGTGANRNRSRVWFSSVVDSSGATGTITWDTSATGNWIDINPDDGADVTGFAEVGGLILVFKARSIGSQVGTGGGLGGGIYRLYTISKTADADNIYEVGAVSQEAITTCRGYAYFFTGQDIRRTNGDYPELVSRNIQDFIDAIPQSSWANVALGNDGWNVYASIGNVTVPATGEDSVTYNNVVLKFSTRDGTWSIHSYGNAYRMYSQFTTTAGGRTFLGSTTAGDVQTVNSGTTDNGTAISFDLWTQEQEFGNKANTKQISEPLVVYTKFVSDGTVFYRTKDDENWMPINANLRNKINYVRNFNATGNTLTLRWNGISANKSPILQGFYIPNIEDEGLQIKS